MKTVIAIAFLAVVCSAQSIPVVALSPADVSKVERIHQAMLDAEKQWTDLQNEITNRYLIVDKGDPDASREEWYPEDHSLGGNVWISSGSTLTISGDSVPSYSDECDPQQKASRDKWRIQQAQRQQEREAKSRRYRKGWVKNQNCGGCGVKDFEYSADWKYLIPKQYPPPAIQQSPWSITNATIMPAN